MQAGGTQAAAQGKQLIGRRRQAWTSDHQDVTEAHLQQCLDSNPCVLPDWEYLSFATDRTESAVRAKVRRECAVLRGLHEEIQRKVREQAKPSPAAAAAAAAAAPAAGKRG